MAHATTKSKKNNEASELSQSQAETLQLIAQYGGEINNDGGFVTGYLASQLQCSSTAMSGRLKELEDQGLISRTMPSARRTTRVKMTKSGWKLINSSSQSQEQSATEQYKTALKDAGNSALLDEVRLRMAQCINDGHAETIENLQTRLQLVASIVKQVNDGEAAPLKALSDIESAFNA